MEPEPDSRPFVSSVLRGRSTLDGWGCLSQSPVPTAPPNAQPEGGQEPSAAAGTVPPPTAQLPGPARPLPPRPPALGSSGPAKSADSGPWSAPGSLPAWGQGRCGAQWSSANRPSLDECERKCEAVKVCAQEGHGSSPLFSSLGGAARTQLSTPRLAPETGGEVRQGTCAAPRGPGWAGVVGHTDPCPAAGALCGRRGWAPRTVPAGSGLGPPGDPLRAVNTAAPRNPRPFVSGAAVRSFPPWCGSPTGERREGLGTRSEKAGACRGGGAENGRAPPGPAL